MPKSCFTNVLPANILIACRELVLFQKARTKFFRCFLLASFLILLSAIKAEAQTYHICPCGVVILQTEICPCDMYYPDADHDGYGNPALGVLVGQGGLPTPPAGYIRDGRDCDDNNSAINIIRWVLDADNDGLHVSINPVERCTSPGPGYVIKTNQQYGDCNDNDPLNKTILYVNKNATGTIHDGSSWEKAYTKLQDALLLSTNACITQIWVAAGTYYPDEGGGKTVYDRWASFSMKNGIAIYGGFSGTETLLSQRNWKINETILSGAIKQNDGVSAYNAFYSYSVIANEGVSSDAVLDGFTITDGNFDFGDNTIIGGGGMRNGGSAPVVTNCIFKNNVANKGGAMANLESRPQITNCIFIGNKATAGAVVYQDEQQATFVNCTFFNNTGSESWGEIFIQNGGVSIVNSIFWHNGSSFGGFGAPSITYSIIRGVLAPGVGNLQVADPGFVDAANGDLRLLSTSLAINTGNDAVNNEPRDLDGYGRRVGVIDMGAYEFGSSALNCTAPPTVLTKNITVQLTAGGNVIITPAQVNNGSFDDCGIETFSLSKSAFLCSDIGANTVTLTATDANGNTASANATVTVEDHVAPTMLTKNITVQLTAAGNVTITAAQVDNGSFDACGIQSYSLSKSTFLCSHIGANTVTLMATDANGNTATANATVTVEDHVAPTMLTKNITVQLTAGGNVIITAAQVDNGSFDACGIQAYSLSKSTFLCSDIGANTVKLTATDANGNTATANATVTVEDHVVPTMLTKNITVQLTAGGNVIITAAQVDNGSFDACGIQSYSLSKSTFLCSDIGANTVKLTATDANGNTATANATVTVEDKIKPVITTCPTVPVQCYNANGTYIIPAAIATDNCGVQSVSYVISGATSRSGNGNNASGAFNPGTSTIAWKATDVNGNTATCTTTVGVDRVDATIADVYASGINSSIGSPNTIYVGYGGSSVTLTAQAVSSLSSNSFTYKWTTGSPSGPGIATTQSITVSPSSTTIYFVSIKDVNNCSQTTQVSKQINVVDIRCGTNKITVCQFKNGSYSTTCVSSSPKTINSLNAGSYLGPCVQTLTAKAGEINKATETTIAIEDLKVTVMPNPSSTNFRIFVSGNNLKEPVKLIISDMLGRVIETRITYAGQIITIGEKYRSGTYAVRIIQSKKIRQLILIKISD